MSCIIVKCSNCVVYLYDMCKAVRVRDPGQGGELRGLDERDSSRSGCEKTG